MSTGNGTEYAIETQGLGREFSGNWAVNGLNLKVPRGCVYGYLGLNGAGKSTTIRMLMGLLQPSAGSATVLGLNPVTDGIELKRRVGYVGDTPNFYEWMTVSEILAFVSHFRKGEWDTARADRLLDVFELPRNQKLKTLSKGQRAKVSLTLALGFNPELLLLDEPTGGLDPIARRQFIEGVLAEYMEGDRTILISSHLINEITGLIDHVGIIRDGKLIRSEPSEKLLGGLRRVKLFFAGDAPTSYACAGLVHWRASAREAQLIIENFDPQNSPAEIAKMGASEVEIETLSLEDAFIELAGKGPQS